MTKKPKQDPVEAQIAPSQKDILSEMKGLLEEAKKDNGAMLDAIKELTTVVADMVKEVNKFTTAGRF